MPAAKAPVRANGVAARPCAPSLPPRRCRVASGCFARNDHQWECSRTVILVSERPTAQVGRRVCMAFIKVPTPPTPLPSPCRAGPVITQNDAVSNYCHSCHCPARCQDAPGCFPQLRAVAGCQSARCIQRRWSGAASAGRGLPEGVPGVLSCGLVPGLGVSMPQIQCMSTRIEHQSHDFWSGTGSHKWEFIL